MITMHQNTQEHHALLAPAVQRHLMLVACALQLMKIKMASVMVSISAHRRMTKLTLMTTVFLTVSKTVQAQITSTSHSSELIQIAPSLHLPNNSPKQFVQYNSPSITWEERRTAMKRKFLFGTLRELRKSLLVI
jgi:hypothetical protein